MTGTQAGTHQVSRPIWLCLTTPDRLNALTLLLHMNSFSPPNTQVSSPAHGHTAGSSWQSPALNQTVLLES